MATKKKAAVSSNLVRAKVTHTQPGSLTYRTEGEVFEHIGDAYEHIEPVDDGELETEEKE